MLERFNNQCSNTMFYYYYIGWNESSGMDRCLPATCNDIWVVSHCNPGIVFRSLNDGSVSRCEKSGRE